MTSPSLKNCSLLKLIAEIVDHTGASQNTLKKRLRELVEAGRIQRHGKARATWHCLS